MGAVLSRNPETTVSARDPSPGRQPSRLRLVVMAALVACLVGALGFVLGATRSGDDPTIVRVDGDALTARQEQMVEVVDGYVSAWQVTDGDLAASFMVDEGFVEYPSQGWVFRADDGTLQDRISNEAYASLRTLDPMLVYADRVVLTGSINSLGVGWISIFRFTASGDVQIVSESIEAWA